MIVVGIALLNIIVIASPKGINVTATTSVVLDMPPIIAVPKNKRQVTWVILLSWSTFQPQKQLRFLHNNDPKVRTWVRDCINIASEKSSSIPFNIELVTKSKKAEPNDSNTPSIFSFPILSNWPFWSPSEGFSKASLWSKNTVICYLGPNIAQFIYIIKYYKLATEVFLPFELILKIFSTRTVVVYQRSH